MTNRRRTLVLTAERIRAYSRRGNYHSDPAQARRVGLPGLLAQGMQAFGPAYGLLLDAWGERLLAHGEIDVKFVGPVWEDDTVEASITVEADTATIEVRSLGPDTAAVVGTAVCRIDT